jgi:hypothetical protein
MGFTRNGTLPTGFEKRFLTFSLHAFASSFLPVEYNKDAGIALIKNMREFLATYSVWFYYGWLLLFIVHVILNHIIYFSINKEEFEDYSSQAKSNIVPMILSIFTFHWPEDYQSDENPTTRGFMKASNFLSPCILIYTFIILFIWAYTYGK